MCGRRSLAHRIGEERGSVTAEAALVLPVVAAFALALVWLVTVALAHVRVVDAARDAAREIARGGDPAAAQAQARATAGQGVTMVVDRSGQDATVTIRFASRSPTWLLVPMPDVDVSATATVAAEQAAP
jgi:Flp pilus assembly protein TadG